jgi:hypothetical protein
LGVSLDYQLCGAVLNDNQEVCFAKRVRLFAEVVVDYGMDADVDDMAAGVEIFFAGDWVP